MTKTEYEKFLEAVDLVCINCAEDTLDNPDVCDSCPVRKTCKMVERKQCWPSAEKAANDFYDGVGKYPYLDNIVDDYNKLMNLVKDVKSLKDIEELVANKSFSISEIEINGMSVGFYKERIEQGFASDIEWICYESFGCLDYIYVFTEESRLPVFDVALETEGHLFENITIAEIDDMESEYWEDVVRKHMNKSDE